jgi:hypothetical protein
LTAGLKARFECAEVIDSIHHNQSARNTHAKSLKEVNSHALLKEVIVLKERRVGDLNM